MGIAGLFIIWTIIVVIFMFSSFKTYTKVSRWFYDDLVEEGKKNGWDFKSVILPLLARNFPSIIILGLLAEEDFFATAICYVGSFFVLKGLAAYLGKNKKVSTKG
jgi:hypothetical protein